MTHSVLLLNKGMECLIDNLGLEEVAIMSRMRDENLMIVTAVEGYSFEHGTNEKDVFDLFRRHNIFSLLRSQYDTLHTQSLDESVSFAEDVLSKVTE